MRRLRPFLSLLLVVLVAAWGEGLCRPAMAAPAPTAPPCHGTAHGDPSADPRDPGSQGHGDERDAPVAPARSCTGCPLCAPVAPRVPVDEDRVEGPTLVLGTDLARPAERPGPRPPVPPPRAVV